MKRLSARWTAVLALTLCLAGCGPAADTGPLAEPTAAPATAENAALANSAGAETALDNREDTDMKMNVQVGNATFTATLENNAAVDALAAMMEKAPVTIEMRDFSGFEKVGSLGTSLPASNRQTTTQPGDIVLYQGDQIVMFYGTNSWSYTRLGHIDDLTGWADALGSGDVTATFTLAQ